MTVYEFTVTGSTADGDELLDVDATVRCSSGTYIRALARDLGAALGTGGHLTRLRRTRVGGYRIEDARTLEQLAGRFEVLPLAQAAAAAFPSRALTADEAHRLAHGGRLGPVTRPPATSTTRQPRRCGHGWLHGRADGGLRAGRYPDRPGHRGVRTGQAARRLRLRL